MISRSYLSMNLISKSLLKKHKHFRNAFEAQKNKHRTKHLTKRADAVNAHVRRRYVNLGIGMPTLAANFLPSNTQIELQSENGMFTVNSASDSSGICLYRISVKACFAV